MNRYVSHRFGENERFSPLPGQQSAFEQHRMPSRATVWGLYAVSASLASAFGAASLSSEHFFSAWICGMRALAPFWDGP